MESLDKKLTEWFLRISISAGLLSAVADRFGLWSPRLSAWGDWEHFIAYVQKLNPFVPASLINFVGGIATFFEILLGILVLTTFKTPIVAKVTGLLFLVFALAMTFASNVKSPLDSSVFIASAGAFALSILTKKDKISPSDKK